jgi:uroporphyrinogen-III synthase
VKRKTSDEKRETSHSGALAGRAILVTRPARQAEQLATLIRAAGGEVILYPVIEIRDIDDPDRLYDLIDRLDEFDLAVFISPNAAHKALSLIGARRALPATLAVAAVGPGTAKALAELGVTNVLAPAGRGDSEALLALPQLAQPRGKRVVVFRGEGGRELLADELTARGAAIEYATCYRRARPAADAARLLDAWTNGALHAVTVTSSEGLRNLCEMAGTAGRALLAKTPVFVSHPRIAETARTLGLTQVIVAADPGDEGLVAALIEHFSISR